MTDGDLSALLTIIAIPAGGLIAWAILWLVLFRNEPGLARGMEARSAETGTGSVPEGRQPGPAGTRPSAGIKGEKE